MFIQKSDYGAATGLESRLMGPSLGGSTSLHVTLHLDTENFKASVHQRPQKKTFPEHPFVNLTKDVYHTHGKSWEKITSFILSNKSTFLA
jgi:hypothetical protein